MWWRKVFSSCPKYSFNKRNVIGYRLGHQTVHSIVNLRKSLFGSSHGGLWLNQYSYNAQPREFNSYGH